jgi:nicotinamidase-related amidase
MTRRRGGKRFAFDPIDPRRTALVVIDVMQNCLAEPCVPAIVSPINNLATSLRAAGGHVAWVVPEALPLQNENARAFFGADLWHEMCAETLDGQAGAILADGLEPQPGDLYAAKSASSAFFPGKCALPDLLTERGIDTVLITGVLTNICCESSARDAWTLGYKVVMVADACAARTDEEHRSALYNVLRNFGDVRMSDDLVASFMIHGDQAVTPA